jgi:polar amino acid transport system substrate-binding protein
MVTSGSTMRVGVDTKWYPLDFGPQTSYVNGFTEDLLLEMARYNGMQFEMISANWDTLLDGLKANKYDAILTSMPPYEYNMAKYEFSKNYLDLGPMLIVQAASNAKDLSDLGRQMVGIITNDTTALILEKHPTIIIRSYSSIPDLLNAVASGDIQGALLARIPAVNFVGDLYINTLKIVGEPLSDAGLHLVAMKGTRIQGFTKTLDSLKKKKTLSTLLKKWKFNN